MLVLKITIIVLQIILGGLTGWAIGSCISMKILYSNLKQRQDDILKNQDRVLKLLLEENDHLKDVIAHSEGIINDNKELIDINGELLQKLVDKELTV